MIQTWPISISDIARTRSTANVICQTLHHYVKSNKHIAFPSHLSHVQVCKRGTARSSRARLQGRKTLNRFSCCHFWLLFHSEWRREYRCHRPLWIHHNAISVLRYTYQLTAKGEQSFLPTGVKKGTWGAELQKRQGKRLNGFLDRFFSAETPDPNPWLNDGSINVIEIDICFKEVELALAYYKKQVWMWIIHGTTWNYCKSNRVSFLLDP